MPRHRLTILTFWLASGLLALALAVPAAVAQPADGDAPTKPAKPTDFKGYDFEKVVQHWEQSLTPLQHEMARKSDSFVRAMQQATELLDAGREREAIDTVVLAVEQVLVVRDRVLKPMWLGQAYFDEQIVVIRRRLSELTDSDASQLDEQTESMLDGIALRIRDTQDDVERRRLTIRYKALRALAEVRAAASRLSPEQRTLWEKVLHVLEDSALVHLQMLVRTEVMFAQFEATARTLRDQHTLLATTRSAMELMKQVNAARDVRAGVIDLSKQTADARVRLDRTVTDLMRRLEADLDAAAKDNDVLLSQDWR